MTQTMKAIGLIAVVYFANLVVGVLFIALSPYSNGFTSTQVDLSSVSGIAALMFWKLPFYWAMALPFSFLLAPVLAVSMFIQLFPAFIDLFSGRPDFPGFFNGLVFVLSSFLVIAIPFFLIRRWNTSLKGRFRLKLGLVTGLTACLNIVLLFTFFFSMSI